jgi:hypothetical protein
VQTQVRNTQFEIETLIYLFICEKTGEDPRRKLAAMGRNTHVQEFPWIRDFV